MGQQIPCSICHSFGHRTRQTEDTNLTPEGGLPFAHTLAKSEAVLTYLLNCLLFIYSSASPSSPAETVFFTDRLWFPATLSTPRGFCAAWVLVARGQAPRVGRGEQRSNFCVKLLLAAFTALYPHILCPGIFPCRTHVHDKQESKTGLYVLRTQCPQARSIGKSTLPTQGKAGIQRGLCDSL